MTIVIDGPVFAVIGDVVASKRQADRSAVQDALVAAMREVNAGLTALQPWEPTVGDEFQCVYAGLGDAVRASLLLRLTLLPVVDTRFGLGCGGFTVFDAARSPMSQDGPAWWAAREAIEQVQARAAASRGRRVRTWFAAADGVGDAAAVNAFLLCRDELVGSMSPRAARLLRGLLLGRQQQEMADAEGISQSAVSQTLSRTGAYAVLNAQAVLRDLTRMGPQ